MSDPKIDSPIDPIKQGDPITLRVTLEGDIPGNLFFVANFTLVGDPDGSELQTGFGVGGVGLLNGNKSPYMLNGAVPLVQPGTYKLTGVFMKLDDKEQTLPDPDHDCIIKVISSGQKPPQFPKLVDIDPV